jgi:hypothetical protein
MASIKENESTGLLETKLYIVFNHEDDGSAHGCQQHLQNIFDMLRQVPHGPPATDGSPKVIPRALENDLSKICEAIHNYSFDIFYHRVTKRTHKLSAIQRYIEQDHANFSEQQRGALLEFLSHVDHISNVTNDALTTKQLPITFIRILVRIYSYWTHNNLLPEDPSADKKYTMLNHADALLAESARSDQNDFTLIGIHILYLDGVIRFKLRRWAPKIMSFVISANRLFRLTQSPRLHKFIRGNFSIQVLSSATTTRYRCHVSSETIQVTLNAAVDETHHDVPGDWDTRRGWLCSRFWGTRRNLLMRTTGGLRSTPSWP